MAPRIGAGRAARGRAGASAAAFFGAALAIGRGHAGRLLQDRRGPAAGVLRPAAFARRPSWRWPSWRGLPRGGLLAGGLLRTAFCGRGLLRRGLLRGGLLRRAFLARPSWRRLLAAPAAFVRPSWPWPPSSPPCFAAFFTGRLAPPRIFRFAIARSPEVRPYRSGRPVEACADRARVPGRLVDKKRVSFVDSSAWRCKDSRNKTSSASGKPAGSRLRRHQRPQIPATIFPATTSQRAGRCKDRHRSSRRTRSQCHIPKTRTRWETPEEGGRPSRSGQGRPLR